MEMLILNFLPLYHHIVSIIQVRRNGFTFNSEGFFFCFSVSLSIYSQGVLNDKDITDPKSLLKALKKEFPSLSCLIIQMKSKDLEEFWDMEFSHYDRTYQTELR